MGQTSPKLRTEAREAREELATLRGESTGAEAPGSASSEDTGLRKVA